MNIKVLLHSTISLLLFTGAHAAELTEAERKAAIAEDHGTVYDDIIQQAKRFKSAPLLKHKLLLKDPLNKDTEVALDPVLLQASKTLQDILENVDAEAVIPIYNVNQQTIDLLVQALKDHTTLSGVPYDKLIEVIELYDFLHIQSTELSLEYLFETIKDNYNFDNLTPDLQELFLRYYFKEYITEKTFNFDPIVFSLEYDLVATSSVTSVALSADGSIAMAGSYDNSAKIVDVTTGKVLHTLQFNSRVNSVALSADGSIAIAGSHDKTAQIFDVKTGNTLHKLQFNNWVSSVALSADGSIAIAGSEDNSAQIFDVKAGNLLHKLQFNNWVSSVALSADGSIAIAGLWNHTAQIFNVKTGQPLHTLKFNDRVYSVALSADGSIAIAGSEDNSAQIFNVKTNQLYTLNLLWVNSVALSADGSIAIIGSKDINSAQIFNVKTNQLLTLQQFNKPISCVALSADGSIAIVGSKDTTAKIIDVKTGNTLHTLQFNEPVSSVALSIDGSIAMAGSEDGTAKIAQPLSTQPIEVLIEKYKTKDEPLPSLTTELSEGTM